MKNYFAGLVAGKSDFLVREKLLEMLIKPEKTGKNNRYLDENLFFEY